MIRFFSRISMLTVLILTLFISSAAQSQNIIHITIGDVNEILGIATDQRCQSWCWAAGLEMLAKSQDIFDVPQEVFVQKIYGCTNPDSPLCCVTSGPFENVRRAIMGLYTLPDGSVIGLDGAYNYGLPTDVFGMIRSIADGRPFILARYVRVNGQSYGHIQVAYGIKYYYTGPNTVQITELELIDPYPDFPRFTNFVVGTDPISDVIGTFELIVFRNNQILPGGVNVAAGGNLPGGAILPGGANFPGGAMLPGGGLLPNGGVIPGGANLPPGANLPGGVQLPGGANLPGGAQLPGGALFPGGNNLPNQSNLPANGILPGGTVLPGGANLPGGAILPGGAVFPNGTVLPPNATLAPGTTLPAGTALPGGGIFPGGALLPGGSEFPPCVLPPIDDEDQPIDIEPGEDFDEDDPIDDPDEAPIEEPNVNENADEDMENIPVLIDAQGDILENLEVDIP